jgi:hypothetical protein
LVPRLKTFATRSFWAFALFSSEGLKATLGAYGAIYAFVEMLDFFDIVTKAQYHKYSPIFFFFISIAWTAFTRRPLSRISYKIPKKDLEIEVIFSDLLSMDTDIVISTNTTFDTSFSNGLISPESIQGQFTLKFFQGNLAELDKQLDAQLAGVPFTLRNNAPGKTKEYPIGTIATIRSHNKNFYFVAMAEMNTQGTAKADVRNIDKALENLWTYVKSTGQLRNLSMPVIGTGRGRISMPRKKMIENIAQSFVYASQSGIFSNKLSIAVHPEDADKFQINLYEVRDYLDRSLDY